MSTETESGTEAVAGFGGAELNQTSDGHRISEPPESIRGFFEHMGPAWVFTASQIGGGEALSVPIGGAYLGMEAIWLIPLITFTKIFGQYYLVRYGVMSGETFLGTLYKQRPWLRWIFYYVFLGGLVYAIGLSGHLGETAGAAQEMLPLGGLADVVATAQNHRVGHQLLDIFLRVTDGAGHGYRQKAKLPDERAEPHVQGVAHLVAPGHRVAALTHRHSESHRTTRRIPLAGESSSTRAWASSR